MNILAIGAHPDDVELGCGGLLIKAASQGHNVYSYTLTRGSASGDPNERIKEICHSADYIGATAWIDNFIDTKLELNDEIINHIEHIVKKSKADIILTHSLDDTHHDHRAIAYATAEAARYVPNILSYEVPITKNFKPSIYYDISDTIDKKIKLINFFVTQKDKKFTKSNAIRGLAQYRTLQSRLDSSVTCVEAFEALKLGFALDFKLLKFIEYDNSNKDIDILEIMEYVPMAKPWLTSINVN